MSFVIPTPDEDQPESPEALFRLLRPRDVSIRDLLLRQGDVLRQYADASASQTDIAVELPTGGGKTLVGLLIAEWRRRKLGNRVAYLCPTKQLVNQVAQKAHDYGLDVVTLVGPQAGWRPADFTRFQRGQAVAIAGYAQIFNSNPRLNSAQTLVLDDAHAAEDAVASNWSIHARRESPLYHALLAAVTNYLPTSVARACAQPDRPRSGHDTVSLVPIDAMPLTVDAIDSALTEYAGQGNDPNFYVRAMLGNSLDRCLMYVSWSEILLRPLIPPTSFHRPFADADQRVYMSATLGAAGELQRAFGVQRISTVSPPARDEQEFGRRFFVLPEATRERPDEVVGAMIVAAGRALILAPSNHEAVQAAGDLVPTGFTSLTASDVEDRYEPFIENDRAVLVLANRYDGIDLPDNACRLIVLTGLPAYAHAQERFIMNALGARRVLSERIRTRIQQGAGRATRNARDFAVVVVRGAALTDFLSRDEEVKSLPPQLQAEIEFGFVNSEDAQSDLVELTRIFWDQAKEWEAAERAITANAGNLTKVVTTSDTALAASAEVEVACWAAVFNDDLAAAVTLAQDVTDRLIGGEDLRPYRAMWFYFAASWTARLAAGDKEIWDGKAKALRIESEGAAKPCRWSPRWLDTPTAIADPALDQRGNLAGEKLRRLGIRGGRFEAFAASTIAQLGTDRATDFEDGLLRLGELLGFEAVRPNGQADPDGAWRDGTDHWILFEAKTEERPDTPLAAETLRQANTHTRWVTSELGWESAGAVTVTIVSWKDKIDPAVPAIAGEVRMVSPTVVRAVAERTIGAIRTVRAGARDLTDDELSASLAEQFALRGLDSATLAAELGARRLADG